MKREKEGRKTKEPRMTETNIRGDVTVCRDPSKPETESFKPYQLRKGSAREEIREAEG